MKNGQGNDKALKEILKLIFVFYQKAFKKKWGGDTQNVKKPYMLPLYTYTHRSGMYTNLHGYTWLAVGL